MADAINIKTRRKADETADAEPEIRSHPPDASGNPLWRAKQVSEVKKLEQLIQEAAGDAQQAEGNACLRAMDVGDARKRPKRAAG
jgi:hypothetical protein